MRVVAAARRASRRARLVSLTGAVGLLVLGGCGEERRGGYTSREAVDVARMLCPGLRADQVHCTGRGDAWRCDLMADNGNVGLVIVAQAAAGTMSPCG